MSQKIPKKDENNEIELVDIENQIKNTDDETIFTSIDSSSTNEKKSEIPSSEKNSKDVLLDEIQHLYKQLEEKDASYNKMHNKYLRALADYDNLQKRSKIEKAQIIKNANQLLLLKFLDVADTFEKTEKTISSNENLNIDMVIDSLKAIQKQFNSILKKEGVERIKAIGKKFDPNFHEVIFVKPEPNFEEDTILEEVEIGYLYNSLLLRPTKVIIAKNESKGEK